MYIPNSNIRRVSVCSYFYKYLIFSLTNKQQIPFSCISGLGVTFQHWLYKPFSPIAESWYTQNSTDDRCVSWVYFWASHFIPLISLFILNPGLTSLPFFLPSPSPLPFLPFFFLLFLLLLFLFSLFSSCPSPPSPSSCSTSFFYIALTFLELTMELCSTGWAQTHRQSPASTS